MGPRTGDNNILWTTFFNRQRDDMITANAGNGPPSEKLQLRGAAVVVERDWFLMLEIITPTLARRRVRRCSVE
jgi:hypothetical protein